MQQRSERVNDELHAIFFAYLEACEQGPKPELKEWIKKYPQYGKDLIQFAVYHHTVEHTTLTDEEEKVLASTTLNIEQEVLDQVFANLPEASPLTSIVTQARGLGLSPELLAASLDLTADIVMKLEQRMLIPASVPDVLLEGMATRLYCDVPQLQAFLGETPAQPIPAFYHAKQPPVKGTQQAFIEAVRGSRMMSSEQKEKWLKIAVDGEEHSS